MAFQDESGSVTGRSKKAISYQINRRKVVTRKLSVLLLSLLFFTSLPLSAEANESVKEAVIPFELSDYLILVKCRINDSKEFYNFVLDTGGIMAIDKKLADDLKLKRLGPQAKIDTLRLGEFAVEKVFAITSFDLTIFKASYGINLSGIIGSNLLDRFIVTIDYEKRQLVLSTDMESLAAAKKSNPDGYLLKFSKHPVNTAPMIKGKLNGKIEVEAMIDTGQPYSLVLPLKELERAGVLQQKNTRKAKGVIIQWPGTTPAGNVLARLNSFETDGLKLNRVMTVFAELPPLLSVPLLGGDFLSRYRLTMDWLHEEILLVPKAGYKSLDHSFSTGLQLKENAEKQLVVHGLWERSPADRAGIQPGDWIREFKSKKVTPELHRELWLLLNDSGIQSVELLIETKKGPRKILLQKEKLI